MITEQKLKQIQQLIKTAKVLTEQEKIEWQALLELMNDKQIAELEEILAPKPVETKAADQESSAPSSLSHISNLPSQISIHKAPPAGPVEAPAPAPAATPKPEPVPPVRPVPAEPKQFIPDKPVTPPQPVTPQSIASRPEPRSEPMEPSEPQYTPQPTIQPATISAHEPIKLTSLEDVTALSSNALHQQNRQVLYKTINDFAAQFGYFQVITSFEQSPLYKDYLDYGKSMLAGQKDGLALSHEEFEFVTDILLSLKVNRF